jgi:hypothetical protein
MQPQQHPHQIYSRFFKYPSFLLVYIRSSRAKNTALIHQEKGDGAYVLLAVIPSELFLVEEM